MTHLQQSLQNIVNNYSKLVDELDNPNSPNEVILKVRGDLKLFHIYLIHHEYDKLFDLLLDTHFQLSSLEDSIEIGDGIVET